ncbi:unnamed protein product [Rotaria magnacalcarata]|uniref:Uncharacterized protein n=2 Tax=Rotaria magnacalcarata TaxID=392030 RepID=A0A816YD14_9BILA|nr:unnamed protein product [Rotaria magnacalcarata]
MAFSVLLVIFLLFLTKTIDAQTLYPTSAGGVGAVYTMTNALNMNHVIIYRLNATGQLTYVNTVNTNGTGMNATVTDPLFSQGSMTVYSNYLFVVNAGSNSLSMFMINTSDATQLTLLSVKPVYGLFPVSVTANYLYACVLTDGNSTGIRCFTYNSSGLFIVPWFDRIVTQSTTQNVPPNSFGGTMSKILFSADNMALIVAYQGYSSQQPGNVFLYPLSSNSTVLGLTPTQVNSTQLIQPSSITLVDTNGLLVTDPGASGILTMFYSSIINTGGAIYNSKLTSINSTLSGSLCSSTYSSKIGNYYVIGRAGVTTSIVELNLNWNNLNPVSVVQYYSLPNKTGAFEATVVNLAGTDYLYVLGTMAQTISGYQLNAAGNATTNGISIVQQEYTAVGIATFVQTSSLSSASSTVSTLALAITIMFCLMSIVFCSQRNE